ncbi:MAG: 30S ribosomal protein S1 [Gammaproteobacteria bacterium]|jgi:small subunit ribosomal protein S1|nr:30S ribosomal protein S1 [Gammaproteobacteria bacterium]MBT7523635.1 30S ribosomal protein S1 [Gammaproteobacteria bacterium]MBT7814169.1 30S ribosomal protein S1 [Gammaproteobacteria bacterium]MDA9896397.1 30S ribosomal protein S1 [Gammaproteobacteria bacterium]|tara:strand:+ start:16 stop:1674 length:1659 start_codon:yes stop_codon:yes gene_type:complete
MSEDFSRLIEESISKLQVKSGAIIMGTVIDVKKDLVIVNAGLKSEGMIPIDQFIGFDGNVEVKEGDTVEVTVDAIEDGFGETKLSREKAKKARAWVSLSEAFEEKKILEGRITGKVKGGFTVDLADIKAFLPGSLVDVRPVRETTYLEGKDLEFIVIKIDKKRNNVVVSRKAVLESENSEERDELISSLEEGSVIKGIVKNITDYGAFLDLGGVDGLLHITDMAWKRVRHPSELINIGDEIDVKVLKFDKEKTRVSLGLKQLNEDPWFEISKAHPEGSKLKGKITNIADYGCFVEIHNGVEGLVHVSEMDWTNKNANPEKLVAIGQEIEVMILDIDPERRRISLGIKQCQPNPWTKFIDNHEIGEIITGQIKSITDFGIFIGLDDGIDGLVHLSDLSWTESGDLAVRNYKKGDELKTILISADTERERISLGVKQLTVNKFQEYTQSKSKGAVVKGKILEKTPKYISIELGDSVVGNLKLSELASDKSVDSMQIGEDLELMITNIDKKNQTINLSMKAFEKQNEDKALNDYKENNESVGSSFGDILKEHIDK